MKNLLKSIVVVITVVVAMFTVNAVVDSKATKANTITALEERGKRY